MTTTLIGSKLRKIAEGMTPKITALRGPRLENTPKRQCQGQAARCEAGNLERVQRAMLKLANAWDEPTSPVPLAFHSLRTKAQIEPLVTKVIDHPSYYVVCETNKWRDNSPLAVEFRAWLDTQQSESDRIADDLRKTQDAVLAREAELKFANIPGFFPTPKAVIDLMLEHAQIEEHMLCLEPSAGKGDILERLTEIGYLAQGFEINQQLFEVCKLKRLDAMCVDFMAVKPGQLYDRVVMNPPFERGQDREHIRRAYQWLKPGGRLVAVASGATASTMAKTVEFIDWVQSLNGDVIKLPDGSFNGAFVSTGVSTCLIVLDKPA
jgi:hypothetical protein